MTTKFARIPISGQREVMTKSSKLVEPGPVLGRLWAVPFWPGFGTQSSWDEVKQWQTQILLAGVHSAASAHAMWDCWETQERKGRNCFSVRQLGLRYWLLSTLLFSVSLFHIHFIGGTEATGSPINPHFLHEFLSLVIKFSKAEYILLCDEQGQGSLRYRCIAWFYKLNRDLLSDSSVGDTTLFKVPKV